jgi:hypothetical protein
MTILIGGIALLGICFLSLIGLYESHQRVGRLLDQLNQDRQKTANKTELELVPPAPPDAASTNYAPDSHFEIYSDVAFTRSLLALSRVRSLDPYGSQAPERAESSLSESFRPVRSKIRDQAP